MSRRATTQGLPSNEKKVNRFHWLSTIEMVDEYIQRGHGFTEASFKPNKFTVAELAKYLQAYEIEQSYLGPLEINIYEDRCGEGIHLNFYHKTPYTDEDFAELEARRQEILTARLNKEFETIRKYVDLYKNDPEGVELATQLLMDNANEQGKI